MLGMRTIEMYSGYNSDHGLTNTFEVNFPPTFTVPQASFSYVTGGGLHKTGIVGFRHRPTADGPEQSVSLGGWGAWPGCVYVNRMTSVTFGTVVGARQECLMIGNMFFW